MHMCSVYRMNILQNLRCRRLSVKIVSDRISTTSTTNFGQPTKRKPPTGPRWGAIVRSSRATNRMHFKTVLTRYQCGSREVSIPPCPTTAPTSQRCCIRVAKRIQSASQVSVLLSLSLTAILSNYLFSSYIILRCLFLLCCSGLAYIHKYTWLFISNNANPNIYISAIIYGLLFVLLPVQ